MSMKKSSDTMGNRTRDLLSCSTVPQPTAQPRAQSNVYITVFVFCSILYISHS